MDYIIIGSGPTGLTLAWNLAKNGQTVTVIERSSVIGGLHRVERVGSGNWFSEHGPRIYSTAYVNTFDLFKEMGMNVNDLFVPYNFSILGIGGKSFWTFTVSEKLWMTASFVNFLINPETYKSETLLSYMKRHEFSAETMDYLDRVARLTDGSGADRSTMYNFFQIVNQNSLNSLLQPANPNDELLLNLWQQALSKTGKVKFILNAKVDSLIINGDDITGVAFTKFNKNETLDAQKGVIIATAPQQLLQILSANPKTMNAFGNYQDLVSWEKKTRYFTYIPMTLHWDKKIEGLPSVHGFPASDYGIAFINLSNYFRNTQGTLISAAVTLPDKVSRVTGKTANQTSDVDELKNEVFRQLNIAFDGRLPFPNMVVLSPELWYGQNKWNTTDSAYVDTDSYHLPVKSQIFQNLFSVGPHNGFSPYDFTSMESAVNNATVATPIILSQREVKSLKKPRELRTYIIMLFLVILIVAVFIWV